MLWRASALARGLDRRSLEIKVKIMMLSTVGQRPDSPTGLMQALMLDFMFVVKAETAVQCARSMQMLVG